MNGGTRHVLVVAPSGLQPYLYEEYLRGGGGEHFQGGLVVR